MENFIAATTPGGIGAQEKRGQIEQTFAQTLPVDMGEYRKDFEAIGFVFGKTQDIFIEAQFPVGWRKKPTDHSMWTEIIDGKGRKRGMIFYKAAFYDRSAHAHLERRFHVSDDYATPVRTVSITDASGQVNRKITGLTAPDWKGNRDVAEKLDKKIEAARRELETWLNANYPDWKNTTAYWD